MPITARRSNGQATSSYSERALYDLVAEVTRYVSPSRPETVSQRAFDRSRTGAGHPDAPSARAICMRLGENGASMPWGLLRRKALAGDLDHDRSHAFHRGRDADLELGEQHLVFALRWAAQEAELPSLTPDRYHAIRRELLRRERRHDHGDHDPLLPRLLPSVSQIERIAADHDRGDDGQHNQDRRALTGADAEAAWDRALAIAGLEPRSVLGPLREPQRRRRARLDRRTRLPLAEAIHHFVEANGELPATGSMETFAKLADIALESKSKPWAEHLDDARAYRSSLGLTTPSENPGPGRPKTPKAEIKIPAGGIPGAPKRRKGRSRYSEADCIADLQRFDREIPASEARTQKRYLAFSVEHGTVPPKHFQRYGGFTELMRKARG
jgi:hypothetical protein